ncbi:odorant receptor 13a-like [Prorops nasuta]|uniref:odorant receptor 13a-like n=1 Tax=Prorops nasuta TaxID=863751 RepID=UPI0034CDFB8D
MSKIMVKEKNSTLNDFQIFCLRLSGIWPHDPNAIWFRIAWTLLLSLMLSNEFYYAYIHFNINKLPEFMETLATIMCFLIGLIKLIIIWCNDWKVKRIVNMIIEDWNECVSRNLEWIYNIMNKNAIFCERCTKSIIVFFVLSVTVFGCCCYIFGSKDYQLILTMVFPFDINNQLNYKIVLVAQYIYLATCAATWFGNITTFMLTLILHIGGQIDVISQTLKNMSNFSEDSEFVRFEIKSLIGKHQRIISMSNDIEATFTYIILVQFLCSSLIICCIGFVIAVGLRTNQELGMLLKMGSYYFPTTFEAFIYCYIGEYLSNKSNAISYMAYEYEWYNLKTSECRLLMVLIMRSQKPLQLTVGKFMNLTLQQFTSIMKLSISYISLLLAVY